MQNREKWYRTEINCLKVSTRHCYWFISWFTAMLTWVNRPAIMLNDAERVGNDQYGDN